MADVLELVGLPKFTGATNSGGKHVEFVSVDKCKVQTWIFNIYSEAFFCGLVMLSV